MDTPLLDAHRLSSTSSGSSSYSSGDDEPLSLSLKQPISTLPPPPPPPHSPPPDMPPPPPPGPPPSVDTKQKIILSDRLNTSTSTATQLMEKAKFQSTAKGLATSRLQSSPVKQPCNETTKIESARREKKKDGEIDKEDDMESYLDESDVFEEDVEAILFAEEEEDRRKGYIDCLSETHLDSAEYPYPAYLGKMATLFTEQNAFGKSPEDYIYCNNLLIRPSQLKLLDARTAALEREKWTQVRRTAALKAKADEKRRYQERLLEALEPPAKRIKISEATIKALDSKQSNGVSSSRPLPRKRSRKKPTVQTPSVRPDLSQDSAEMETVKPSIVQKTKKVNGKALGGSNRGPISKKSSSRTKKGTTNAARATTKTAASRVKATKAPRKEQLKHNTITNSKEVNVEAKPKKNCAEADDDRGNESSSSSSSTTSSSSSSSVNSSSSSSSSSASSRLSLSSSSSDNDTGAD